MKQVKKHLSAIMGRMLFIGFCVQIAFGLFWMLCNFGARQDFALRGDGLLYPVLLRVAPHYCVVYFIQAAAALWAGYVFLKAIRPSRFWNIWGSLAIFTVPMGMQCHLALLPDSLISSLMLLECALFWKAAGFGQGAESRSAHITQNRTILFAKMAACWLCLAFLDEMYLYFGGILPLLLLLVTVCGRERFRIVPLILLFASCAGIVCGTYDLAKMAGVYEKEPGRVSEMLFKRFVCSTLLKEWGDWPEQLAERVDGSILMNASFYADGFDMELKPALSMVMSQEEMDGVFTELAKRALQIYPKRIMHECGWDLAGYVFSPTIAGLMLEGRGCASYCLRNYDIMGRAAPKLTQYYVDYACRWFSAAFLLAAFLEICTAFGMGKAALCRKWRCFAAYAVTCICPVLWYVAQGAGIMDYKRTVFVTGLWVAWQSVRGSSKVVSPEGETPRTSTVCKANLSHTEECQRQAFFSRIASVQGMKIFYGWKVPSPRKSKSFPEESAERILPEVSPEGETPRTSTVCKANLSHTALPFFIGLLVILAAIIPYLILGQDAIVTYHDQLDGELIAYRLQAKHLFDKGGLPEFLGGASKTALIPPAPACVLLFLWGDGFAALAVMQLLGSLCGYLGMYLLVKRETKAPLIGAAVGVLYGLLPFLPVYGLTQYGLPLLLFCILEAGEGRHLAAGFFYAALFALNSSLVLAGFAVLGCLALWMLAGYLKDKSARGLKNCFFMWILMLGIYVAENIGLFAQIFLQGEGSLSHKAEYQLLPENVLRGFWDAFLQGGQHSEDYHGIFLWVMVIVAVFAFVWMCRTRGMFRQGDAGSLMAQFKVMGICVGFNALFAVVAALWNGTPGIFLRNHMQALGAFQMERFLWLAPCLWYLAFGCCLGILTKLWKQGAFSKKSKATGFFTGVLTLCAVAVLCQTGWKVFLAGNLKPNLQKIINPGYPAMSWRDYYAIGVLSQVEDFLEEREGVSKEGYRVASLGIDPAASLYHGFYCLDGYSNNYSLAYKHTFRRALEPELRKSEYLTDYFDNWGNRCYLFSAECPGYYTIEKGGFYFSNYELDTEALRELGGKYLFSAAYIANAGEQGLTLLREEAFETEDSYYRIFVYQF